MDPQGDHEGVQRTFSLRKRADTLREHTVVEDSRQTFAGSNDVVLDVDEYGAETSAGLSPRYSRVMSPSRRPLSYHGMLADAPMLFGSLGADADIVAHSALHGPVEVPVSELTARIEVALQDRHDAQVGHTGGYGYEGQGGSGGEEELGAATAEVEPGGGGGAREAMPSMPSPVPSMRSPVGHNHVHAHGHAAHGHVGKGTAQRRDSTAGMEKMAEIRAPFLRDMIRAQQPLLVIEYRRGWPTAIYRHMRRHDILAECVALEKESEAVLTPPPTTRQTGPGWGEGVSRPVSARVRMSMRPPLPGLSTRPSSVRSVSGPWTLPQELGEDEALGGYRDRDGLGVRSRGGRGPRVRSGRMGGRDDSQDDRARTKGSASGREQGQHLPPSVLAAVHAFQHGGSHGASSFLQPRDLRVVDPEFEVARDPAVLARRHCLVVNLPPVRAIVLPDRCMFFPEAGADADLGVMLDRFSQLGKSAVATQAGKVGGGAAPLPFSPLLSPPPHTGTGGTVEDDRVPFGFYAIETFLMSCLEGMAREYRDVEPLIARLTGGTGMPPPLRSSYMGSVGGGGLYEMDVHGAGAGRWAVMLQALMSALGMGGGVRGTNAGSSGPRQGQGVGRSRGAMSKATTDSLAALEGSYRVGGSPAPATATFDALRSAKARVADILTRVRAVHRVLAELLDTPNDLTALALIAVVELEEKREGEEEAVRAAQVRKGRPRVGTEGSVEGGFPAAERGGTHLSRLAELEEEEEEEGEEGASLGYADEGEGGDDTEGTSTQGEDASTIPLPAGHGARLSARAAVEELHRMVGGGRVTPPSEEGELHLRDALAALLSRVSHGAAYEGRGEVEMAAPPPRRPAVKLDSVRDAAEVLLEAYLAEVESLMARAKLARDALDGAENSLNLVLASNRNRLLRVEIFISTITAIMALCAVVGGYYGMNTPDVADWSPAGANPWLTIVLSTSVTAGLLFICSWAYLRTILS